MYIDSPSRGNDVPDCPGGKNVKWIVAQGEFRDSERFSGLDRDVEKAVQYHQAAGLFGISIP
jgi:hypothetical protein